MTRVLVAFDGLGNIENQTEKSSTSSDETVKKTYYFYEGRLCDIVDANENVVSYDYDVYDRITGISNYDM